MVLQRSAQGVCDVAFARATAVAQGTLRVTVKKQCARREIPSFSANDAAVFPTTD